MNTMKSKRNVMLLVLIFCCSEVKSAKEGKHIDIPKFNVYPCNGSEDIMILHEPSDPSQERNKYQVLINKSLTKNTKIILKFDSDVNVSLAEKGFARIFAKGKNTFEIRIFKLSNGVVLIVQGQLLDKVPHITSLVINMKEYCNRPFARALDDVVVEHKHSDEISKDDPKDKCGRRKVAQGKIADSALSEPGDWPWHTAIYENDDTEIKYICGGTLLSNKFVLTAAQCTTSKGVPIAENKLSVFLGKFNLIGGNEGSQERQVDDIIIHEEFDSDNLDNDIALLKLKKVIKLTDFVQPACLLHGAAFEFITDDVDGTIVGWGFDSIGSGSPHLQQVKMSLVTESICLQSNPLVYSSVLNSNKFCAGYGVLKGTSRSARKHVSSSCSGDLGSAFQVFVPDKEKNKSSNISGTWYVRGILTLIVSRPDSPVCDPQQYVVFTDVKKYTDWIERHLNDEED